MRLSISNIAWDPAEDEAVLALLQAHAVDAIDIAPTKYFPDPMHASESEIARVRRWWNDRGVELVGMQSLLFGTSGLNMFGSDHSQKAMLSRLTAVARIGAGLGATRLVFGSPRNRDRSGLTDQQTLETAIRFFQCLGDVAADSGVTICLEPNPTRYGANFMTSTEETARVVTEVGHANVRMQLDTGAITVNAEDVDQVVRQHANLIAHVHASEPDLKTLGDGATPHQRVHDALRKHVPDRIVTIEMTASENESHLSSIGRALETAISAYRPPDVPQRSPLDAHR